MGRTEYNISQVGFIADQNSVDYSMGYDIDWDTVVNTDSDGNKYLPAGTIVAINTDTPNGIFERSQGLTDGTNPYPAVGILLEGINEQEKNRAQNGQAVIVGGVIYDSLLPDSGDANFATFKTELQDLGSGFHWEKYADDRAS